MMNMFANCYKLTSIDVDNFNTSQVISAQNMFAGCSKLESLNLSGFDMGCLSDGWNPMGGLLQNCIELKLLYTPNKMGICVIDLPNTFTDGVDEITSFDSMYEKKILYKLGTIPPIEVKFTDIKEGAWYVQYVQYVFENGLMNGTSENSFEPDSTLTREMFAQILYSQAGKPKVTASNPFSDVEEGTWYRDAVVWAYSNGIVSGVVDTPTEKKFGVETPITREQLALMMYRYAEKTGMDMGVEENVFAGFGDTDEVSDWATDGVGWAISHSIMKGKPNTDNTMILDPLGKATRAECATMVMNLVTMKD